MKQTISEYYIYYTILLVLKYSTKNFLSLGPASPYRLTMPYTEATKQRSGYYSQRRLWINRQSRPHADV